MKKCYLVLLLSFSCGFISAQKFISIDDKAFNWGGKVGFNSTFPIINSLEIEDVKATDIRLQYKVGYLAAIFCRININKFFMQPSFSWRYSEGDIRFNTPQEIDNQLNGVPSSPHVPDNQLKYRTATLELPVMIGYYLVKEGPYALSMMVGPSIKYNYKTRYTTNFTNSPREYSSDSTPYGINIATGLGVSIWRLFFDFTYEFGLNHIESDFKEIKSHLPPEGNITINKRTNIMSFSLGFLF